MDLDQFSSRWVNDPPEPGQQTIDRLKGRLMQAEMDLYRLREFSVAKMEKLLVAEVETLEALAGFSEEEMPDEKERRTARHESLKKGGTLRYCASCGEFVILVAGRWEADGLTAPYCYDMTARLTCERSGQGHMP